MDRVRIYRPQDLPYLEDRPAVSNIRQYGYVICGRRVEIWEMKVDVHEGSLKAQNGDETMCGGTYFKFPSRLLDSFSLVEHQGITNFGQWHEKIMTWGLHKYARDYVKTVNALMQAKINPKEWLLGYATAIGKELTPMVQVVFKDTGK